MIGSRLLLSVEKGILGLSENIGDREGKLLFVEENILYR